MKKRLLFSLVAGMFVLAANAQNTPQIIKSVELQNADFSQGEPVKTIIRTYDYDMPDDGVGADGESMFGQQEIAGWTASHPSDNIKSMHSSSDPAREDGANARAAGIFAYLDGTEEYTAGLGGEFYAPYLSDSPDHTGNNVLGMIAVWGADLKYSQDVTLPAGDYMLIVKLWNAAGTGTFTKSNMGFATAEKSYVSSKNTYPAQTWTNDTIFFQLTAETAGQVTLGFAFGGGSGSVPHVFVDAVELYQIDPSYLIQVEIDKAKEKLLEAIEEGELYNVDTDEALVVYNNPKATLEEVMAAIEAQKERNQAGLTDLSEFFINNPHFSEGTPVEGGICTYQKDCEGNGISKDNYSLLPIPEWTPNQTKKDGPAGGMFAVGSGAFVGGKDFVVPDSLSDGRKDGNLMGMCASWSNEAYYKQYVTIPAGQYSVSISYYNAGGANAINKNMIGFIADDKTEYLATTTKFPVKKWAKETIKFTLDKETSGYFTLGYKAANDYSSTQPHLFVDGFSLIYVGSGINASLMGLTSQVNGGKELLAEEFNAELKNQFRDVINAGQALVDAKSEDTEANKAATAAIKNMLADVNASIQAYKDLNNFRNDELIPAADKYTADMYGDLKTQLDAMLDEVNAAQNNFSWTTAKINEVIASLPEIIKEGVQSAWNAAVESGAKLPKNLDITALFNLNYTYSTTAVGGDGNAANVPDKEWSYGDATNFKTQYGTAEVWNQSPFMVSRTLTGLPAGKYTITTKGFFRNAANTDNYANYTPGSEEVSVFANLSTTSMTNVALIAVEGTEEAHPEGWAAANDEKTYWVPNSQKAAYDLFNDAEQADLLQKSVSCVVSGKGELVFGIMAEQMQDNSWAVWYGFEIAYNALEADDMVDALAAMREQATENIEDEYIKKVTEAVSKLQAAMDAHEAVDKTNLDALRSVMAQYEAAFEYADEADSLYKVLDKALTIYNYLGEEYQHSDEYSELLNNADVAVNNEVADNETMQQLIDNMRNQWSAAVVNAVAETATKDAPEDVSGAIYNNSFTDPAYTALEDDDNIEAANNANGWTITREGGKDEGQGKTSDGATAYDQRHVYEFYDAKAFSISQQLTGLPAGYYTVEVQGFYRGINSPKALADTLAIDPEFGKNVYLFAKSESAERHTVLNNIFQRMEGDDGSQIDDGSNETAVAYGDIEQFYVPTGQTGFNIYAEYNLYWNSVSIHIEEGETLTLGLRRNSNNFITGEWCVFDNFRLKYYGNTEAPDAVNGINADVKTQQAIYNVAGQRVQKAVKGLYIVNGKIIIVK